MKDHFSLKRGVAAACAVAGAATLLNGNCSAQNLIAADYATNATYAAGWTEVLGYNDRGQNGGYGFGGWNMSPAGQADPAAQHAIDHTSPYDPFGAAWTLYNPHGLTPNTWPGDNSPQPTNSTSYAASPGTCVNPPTGYAFFGPGGYDNAQAGRAMPNGEMYDSGLGYYVPVPGGGLQIGQTFSTVIANPSDRAPYGGYTIALENWPENRPSSHGDDVVAVGTFEYYGTLGRWYTTDTFGDYNSRPNIYDLDTTTNGMQIDITVTSASTYHLVLTPLGNPGNAFSEDGTFAHPGPIVWVTYELFNTDSNFYPPGGNYAGCGGPDRTDFYIKSMTVSGLTLNIQRAGTNVLLSWRGIFTNFTLVSSTNLVAPVWNPVSTDPPGVVSGQNVVTNPIAGAQKFYRLQFQQ